jgi:hypothetical protein
MDPTVKQQRALMMGWVDGELAEQDHAQLQVALRDPAQAREFLRTVHLQLALRRVARAQVQRQQVERSNVSTRRRPRSTRRVRPRQSRGWWLAWATASAALLLLAVGGMLLRTQDAPRLEAGAVAIELSGVLQPPGSQRDLTIGSLVTVPPTGTATLTFADGTRLVLGGDTRMRVVSLDPGKRVELTHGELSAEVAKQPSGAPLVIATPRAETTVVGTRLSVRSDRDVEQVTVSSGRVRVLRLSDQSHAEVAAAEAVDLLAPGTVLAQRVPPAAGLQMWLDADRGAEADAAGLVGRWRDRSGHARDLVQSREEARPQLITTDATGAPRHALIAFARPQDCLASLQEWPRFTAFSVAGLLRPQELSVDCQTFGSGWGCFAFHGTVSGGIFTGVGLSPSPIAGPNRFTPDELSPGTLAVGRWLRFVLVHEPEHMSFYRDGRLVARLPTVVAPQAWPSFAVGAAHLPGLNGSFRGELSEILVYDRALDADEIVSLDERFRTRAASTP